MKGWSYSLICGVLSTASAFASAEWMGVPFATTKGNDSTVDTARTFNTSTSGGKLAVAITTPGQDIWYTLDRGSFYFSPEIGDCEVVATIPPLLKEGVNTNIGASAKAGVMFRLSTYANAPMVMFLRETTLTNEVGEASCKSRLIYRAAENANAVDLKTTTSDFPPDADVRCRLIREDNLFTAYYSTNTPYADWIKFADWTAPDGVFPDGILGGLALSPQISSATIAVTFDDVAMRQRVSTEATAGAITVTWPADVLLSEGDAVEDYTVSRTETGTETWSPIASVDGASATTFEDTSAVVGTSYRYRVAANVQHVDESTGSIAVGDSYKVRIPLQTSNSQAASQTGLTTEFTQNGKLVGSFVYFTSVYNPWNGNADRIYPDGAQTGLVGLDNFSIAARGIFRVATTGLYQFDQLADDKLQCSVNGQLLSSQGNPVGRRVYSSPVFLEAGRNYPVTYAFVEGTGQESCELRFRRIGGPTSWAYVGANCEPVPSPWTAVELGESPVFGNAIYSLSGKSFTLVGSGLGWEGIHDEAQTCSLDAAAGDLDFIARLILASGDNGKAGILLRADPMSTAPEQVVLSISNRIAQVFARSASGGLSQLSTSLELPAGITSSALLRFSRRDDQLRCFVTDGNAANLKIWTEIGSAITLPSTLAGKASVGLCAASGSRASTTAVVFDKISLLAHGETTPTFSFTEGTGDNTVNLHMLDASPAATRNAQNNAILGYFWADDIACATETYDIWASPGPLSDGIGDVLHSGAQFGEAVPYTFATDDLRALAYFTAQGMTTIFGDSPLPAGIGESSRYGYVREAPSETGTGLLCAFYSSTQTGPAGDPGILDVGGLPAWDVVQNGNFKTATQTTTSKSNFYSIWSGYVTAPYSAWYRFRSDTDDYTLMTIDGIDVFKNQTANATPTVSDSNWLYLTGGKRVPLFVMYRQGNSTTSGRFSLQWEHGAGLDGSFEALPLTSLSSDLAAGAPVRVDPLTEAKFGDWTSMQLGTLYPRNALIHGTTSNKIGVPDKMNIAFMSCSKNPGIYTTADNGHFLYRSVAAGQDFQIEADVSRPTAWSGSARQGLMIRGSLDTNARAITVFRTQNNVVISQLRATVGGTLTSSTKRIDNYTGDSLRMKIVREGKLVRTYYDDVLQETYNVETWGGTFYVGYGGSSWAPEHMSVVFLSNAEFTLLPKKCTMVVIR